jgi:hypothetical protein
LKFTDRSRFIDFFSCPFKRYIGYHYLGKGISRQGHAIPLATGTYTHEAIEKILNIIKTTGDLPSVADMRDIINKVTNDYIKVVEEAGFLGLSEGERPEYVVTEQTTLISGLVWAWAVFVLPTLLEEFDILHVEQEMERIVGCDCGLSGVGEVKDHRSRGCNCIVIMTRPDIIVQNINTNAQSYVELKTGGKIESSTFEGDVQFAFGASGVEGFTGKELASSFVHALSKGYRIKAYNKETKQKDGLPYQASSLCYAYVSEGISGMVPQDISFKYTKKKGYKRTPVWEIDFKNIPEGVTKAEHYISLMSDKDLEANVNVHGPYPYPKQQVEELLLDVVHLETRNEEIFAYIDSLVQEKGLGDEETQEELHKYIPKSWNCKTYNTICNFYPICTKTDGWEDPLNAMYSREGEPIYAVRDPNHPCEFEV